MKVRKIQYFSPDGSTMPNGVNIQRGGFLAECNINSNSFRASQMFESMVILPLDAEPKEDCPYLTIVDIFMGRYFDEKSGCRFDSESMIVPFYRKLSKKRLSKVANEIATYFGVKAVLVKDCSNNSFFMVDA